jgi:menaquinone-dependent protoporphyrinogen oxidase
MIHPQGGPIMTILILYATTEGQTRKIARHVARRLIQTGQSVEVLSAAEAWDTDFADFDGAILLASLHVGAYQGVFIDTVTGKRDALARMPTLFLSVSLAAASDEAEDRADLDERVRAMTISTGWVPGRVSHVAGAFRWDEYDFFKTWAMRWIATKQDPTVKPGQDKEYTDWAALDRVVDEWAASVPAPAQATARSA